LPNAAPPGLAGKSPSDLHYIVTGTALLLSAGSGVLVASQIVMVLAKEDKTGLLTPRLRNIEDSREDTAR